MEKFLLTALLCGTMFPGMAQNNVTAKNETGMKTIRLVYPQWQGGNIAQWITEVKDHEQASRGYYLGAQRNQGAAEAIRHQAPDTGRSARGQPCGIGMAEIVRSVQSRHTLRHGCARSGGNHSGGRRCP